MTRPPVPLRAALWRRLLDESGQGMTEYAATSTVLLVGIIGVGGGWPFFSLMMTAFNNYLSSLLFVLNTPFP